MNGTSTMRSRSPSLLRFLLLVWLFGLSVAMVLNYRLMTEWASREQVDSGLRQLHVLETRVTELTDAIQALQARPEFATKSALADARQTLEARLLQLERALAGRAASSELETLQTGMEQIKSRLEAIQVATLARPRPRARPATRIKPREEPLPFRVMGMELRAGRCALSIAPASGELTAGQLQVILPGESVGPWRLQAIDGNTATFQAGERTRRLPVPLPGIKQ